MKIKKVAALCSKSKVFYLCNVIDKTGVITQWLGDGVALYQIAGFPHMDAGSICAIFDISEKKKESIHIKCLDNTPAGLCFDDTDPTELAVDTCAITVLYHGKALKPIQTRHGVVFIDAKHISPLEDVFDGLEYFERQTITGKTYIVAKTGMLIAAVIYPQNVIDNEFVNSLDSLCQQCKLSLKRDAGGAK